MSSVIVLGSGRANGNTAQLAQFLSREYECELIDLSRYSISPYGYDLAYDHDDFSIVIEKVMAFDEIIFATPVYWYAPSAQLKIFMDRLTSLTTLKPAQGRQLREKSASVLATGASEIPEPCFESIFYNTFKYLGISYQGMLYCSALEEIDLKKQTEKVRNFAKKRYDNVYKT